jgi:hypothetical protein
MSRRHTVFPRKQRLAYQLGARRYFDGEETQCVLFELISLRVMRGNTRVTSVAPFTDVLTTLRMVSKTARLAVQNALLTGNDIHGTSLTDRLLLYEGRCFSCGNRADWRSKKRALTAHDLERIPMCMSCEEQYGCDAYVNHGTQKVTIFPNKERNFQMVPSNFAQWNRCSCADRRHGFMRSLTGSARAVSPFLRSIDLYTYAGDAIQEHHARVDQTLKRVVDAADAELQAAGYAKTRLPERVCDIPVSQDDLSLNPLLHAMVEDDSYDDICFYGPLAHIEHALSQRLVALSMLLQSHTLLPGCLTYSNFPTRLLGEVKSMLDGDIRVRLYCITKWEHEDGDTATVVNANAVLRGAVLGIGFSYDLLLEQGVCVRLPKIKQTAFCVTGKVFLRMLHSCADNDVYWLSATLRRGFSFLCRGVGMRPDKTRGWKVVASTNARKEKKMTKL